MFKANGFEHIDLKRMLNMLTIFTSPFGHFIGICQWGPVQLLGISEETKLTQILEGLSGVDVIADGISRIGEGQDDAKAEQDHDWKL